MIPIDWDEAYFSQVSLLSGLPVCANDVQCRRIRRPSASMLCQSLLPSIGVRYEFTSHAGERIGIIARRSGCLLYTSDAADE